MFQLDTNSTSETDVLHHLRCIIAAFLPFIPKALHTTNTDIYTLSLQNKTRKYIFQIESNSEGGGCFVWLINKTGQMVLCMLDSTREVWEAKHILWPSRKLEIKAKNRRHEFQEREEVCILFRKTELRFFFFCLGTNLPVFQMGLRRQGEEIWWLRKPLCLFWTARWSAQLWLLDQAPCRGSQSIVSVLKPTLLESRNEAAHWFSLLISSLLRHVPCLNSGFNLLCHSISSTHPSGMAFSANLGLVQ